MSPTRAFVLLRVEDPLVAWLTYRGEMVGSTATEVRALSFWMTAHLRERATGGSNSRFLGETKLESFRKEHYPSATSRLTGFFAFPEERSARRAQDLWGDRFRSPSIAEIAIGVGSRVSCHDAQWISNHISSGDSSWMDSYWKGEPAGSQPVWELLVNGRAHIYGTREREAAYEVVERTWPRSLATLELARLAVQIGSDLGLISALAVDGSVSYFMNFVDAQSEVFLERLRTFDGPKNLTDLTPDSALVLPDLARWGFVLSS